MGLLLVNLAIVATNPMPNKQTVFHVPLDFLQASMVFVKHVKTSPILPTQERANVFIVDLEPKSILFLYKLPALFVILDSFHLMMDSANNALKVQSVTSREPQVVKHATVVTSPTFFEQIVPCVLLEATQRREEFVNYVLSMNTLPTMVLVSA